MPWYSKEQATPFDSAPIEGLTFLNGDVMAQVYRQPWVAGQKYPMVSFPSGLTRELWDSSYPGGIVQVWGGLELLRQSGIEEAYAAALEYAQANGYRISYEGDELLIENSVTRRGYRVSYDQQSGQLVNIERSNEEDMELLDSYSRAVLPELYANERLGMNAVAPVKFFTPDAGWTWWPTEFDGEDIFFGLVSGLEVELGYFSLTELESIRGPLGLPIERDLYFEPTTLRELIDDH